MAWLPRTALAAALTLGQAASGYAAELIINGGFETGFIDGWSAGAQAGSSGNVAVVPNNGAPLPAPISTNAFAVNPTGGTFFATTVQTAPGSYVLTQTFTVPLGASLIAYSFDVIARNYAVLSGADPTYAPGRDFTAAVPAQNAVVDILRAGADPFTEDTADILFTLYNSGVDPVASEPQSPWTTYSGLLALGAGTYQIRFAETDNVRAFNLAVDNVSITAEVSETPVPGALPLFASGLSVVGLILRRRRNVSKVA